MKKFKKTSVITCALVCSLFMSQATYVKATEVTETPSTIISDTLRLQDDFYSVTNKSWLNTAKIDAGQVSNSTFMEANKVLTGQKKEIIKELLANEKSYSENSDEKKIINLYKNVLNTEARNKQGIEPIKGMLNEIKNIRSLDDITNLNKDSKVGNTLIGFRCSVDLKDATKYALYIDPSRLTLGNSDEYVKPTGNTARIKGLYENYYTKILTLVGYTTEEAKTKIDNSFKFENMIAPSIIGNEEVTKNSKIINDHYTTYSLDELEALAPNLNIKNKMHDLKIDKANKIILMEPKWLKALNDNYTEKNFALIKDYLEIKNLAGAAGFLGEDFQKASTEFSNSYVGSKGELPKDEQAIGMVDTFLGESLGKIYVEKYFSKKTKDDVEHMTNEFIENYKNRIKNLDWMSETTKKNAIEKLDKLNVQVGYPEKWDDFSNLEIRSFEEGGSLCENVTNFLKMINEETLNRLNESVDKSEFGCLPQTINAFYNATKNRITIPAGILQGQFYNPNASREHNLGAIGAIIGHEISHAFDNNGAKYDADGNLNSWWTDEDYKKFEEKTNKVKNFYNKLKTDRGNNVNGYLTAGENIADIGGIACSLDILKQMPNPNYKEFFESNSNVWRQINTKEYEDYAIQTDPHSPNKVRTNVVLAQFDKFYETYGIKENDKMYIKPEDRLQIW